MPDQSIHLLRATRDLAIRISGGGLALVGALMIANGPGGLASGVFTASRFLPHYVWGSLAIAAGALALVPATRYWGVRAVVAWYALWGVILAIGAIEAHRSLYAIAVYFNLVCLQVLLVILHDDQRRVLKQTR